MPPRRLPARSLSVLVLSVVMVLAGLAVPSTAHAADPVDPDQYLVGGCRITFEWGWPKPEGSADNPCVGVESLSRNSKGDLVVHLTPEESEAAIRLMAQAGEQMASRGVVAGANGGRDSITIRLYDDRRSERVSLSTSRGRERVARTDLWVGWTKQAGRGGAPNATEISPGHDQLGHHRDRAATSWNTVPGGCVIRFSSAGPRVYANDAHRCIGVRSVGVTASGRLSVRATPEQTGAVVNAQADPDETLTSRGLATGIAVSRSRLYVTFYDSRLNRRLDLTDASDLRRVSGSWSNLWLTWTKTTRRPGSPNASYTTSRNDYGAYQDGSVGRDDVVQTGCSVRFARVTATPSLNGNSVRLCTGTRSVSVNEDGEVVVSGGQGHVVSTTTISSRTLTDYGVRAGMSGGVGKNRYRMYSMRLGRSLDLRRSSDRLILQRTGSELLTGWSHWVG